MMRVKGSILTGLLVIMLLPGCGNSSLNIFSTADDIELGKNLSEQIAADPGQFPVLDSLDYPRVYLQLRKITEKILASRQVQHRDQFSWQIRVIQDDSVLNAFCTPGGYIFIYTGLIRFLESEDQLAGVLGHEIAHADLRHSTEQLTKNMGVRLLTRLIAGDASLIGNTADQLLQLGFSRQDETEADLKSVEYLYDTDYDARGVARFFERMKEQNNPVTFLSTHPDPENRVAAILDHWRALGARSGKTYTAEYRELVKALP